jgi:hypothetical protein
MVLKKLEILPIPSLYIYSLMLFILDNLHYFQIISSVHKIITKYKNHLHIPSIRLASTQRGTTSSHIKLFNKLPPRISGPKNDMTILKSALKQKLDKFYIYIYICVFF